jgi:hypothetical protein
MWILISGLRSDLSASVNKVSETDSTFKCRSSLLPHLKKFRGHTAVQVPEDRHGPIGAEQRWATDQSPAQPPIRVMSRVPARYGKKTDEGTMMLSLAHESNLAAVAEPPQTRTLTPATTEEASDILINGTIKFCGGTQN